MKMESRAQVKSKFECKDLAPQVVPDCTPEVKVGEHFLSKSEDHLLKKKPEWDWPPLSPATELVAACRHLEVANRKLEEKWSEGKETQKQMDKQWEELREREVQLRESFTHFNKFVELNFNKLLDCQDNSKKRERAERKILHEKTLQEQQEKEIMELREKLDDFTQIKKTLEKHVNKHKIYEDYLKTVVASTKEFSTVFDILNRYEILSAVCMELTKRQGEDLATLENAYNDTVRLTEEVSRVMLGLNNQLADLQSHYDQAKAKTLRWETALSHIESTTAEKKLELNQVQTSCWNMYREICRCKNMPVKLEAQDVEQQMVHIKHAFQELKKIADIAHQRANMEAASNMATRPTSRK